MGFVSATLERDTLGRTCNVVREGAVNGKDDKVYIDEVFLGDNGVVNGVDGCDVNAQTLLCGFVATRNKHNIDLCSTRSGHMSYRSTYTTGQTFLQAF